MPPCSDPQRAHACTAGQAPPTEGARAAWQEPPAAAQVEALTEKLENTATSRQPVLESSKTDSSEGDPSLWSAEYAKARSASAPAASVDGQNSTGNGTAGQTAAPKQVSALCLQMQPDFGWCSRCLSLRADTAGPGIGLGFSFKHILLIHSVFRQALSRSISTRHILYNVHAA